MHLPCCALQLCDALLRADRCLLRERCRKRRHVLSVVEAWRGGEAACVAAVRLVQRPDAVRQLRWNCDVGSLDAGY